MVERHKEHVHILETRGLCVKLRLEYTVVHKVDAGHTTHNHIRRLVARMVPMMVHSEPTVGLRPDHRRVNHPAHMQRTVAARTNAAILVQRVRLVHGSGRRAGGDIVRADARVQHVLRDGARHVHHVAARG